MEKLIKSKIEDLKKRELYLFNTYNRHYGNSRKLEVLEELKTTIIQLNTLQDLK